MNLRDQIKAEEGLVLHAYPDNTPDGYLTIGHGRLIDQRKGGGISREEAEYLLDNDIIRKTDEVLEALPWLGDLNEQRQAVLIGMAFQLGTAGLLGFKNTLAAVKKGRFADAANHMLASKWARQTPARARRMAAQMRTGEWSSTGV